MADDAGAFHLFVYDTEKNLWHREDNTQAKCFCACRNSLYFLNQSGQIISVTGEGGTEPDFS